MWEAAQIVFEDDAQVLSDCPVCNTPLDRTSKGGRDRVTIHLKEQLDSLNTYRTACVAVKDARAKVEYLRGTLRAYLARLQAQLKAVGYKDTHPVLSATETYSLVDRV